MIITAHGVIVLADALRIDALGVLLYPGLERRISRLLLLDIVFDCLLSQGERGASHRVKPLADPGITGCQLAGRFQRDLLPEPRQVQNAKWTGGAGADQGNVGSTHGLWVVLVLVRCPWKTGRKVNVLQARRLSGCPGISRELRRAAERRGAKRILPISFSVFWFLLRRCGRGRSAPQFRSCPVRQARFFPSGKTGRRLRPREAD